MDYNLILFLTRTLNVVLVTILLLMNYPLSKRNIKNKLRVGLVKFHKSYVQGNYQLSVKKINSFRSINSAIRVISDNREEYFDVPDDKIRCAKIYLSILKNYDLYSKGIYKIICLLITMELGIVVGLCIR